MHDCVCVALHAGPEYFSGAHSSPLKTLNLRYLKTVFAWFPALLLAVCSIAAAQAQSLWQGTPESGRLDITQSCTSKGSNLSGAVWNPVTGRLWVVSNGGIFWRMSCAGDSSLAGSCSVDNNGAAEKDTSGTANAGDDNASLNQTCTITVAAVNGARQADIAAQPILGDASAQDATPARFSVEDGGETLHLTDNSWKAINMVAPYLFFAKDADARQNTSVFISGSGRCGSAIEKQLGGSRGAVEHELYLRSGCET